MTRRRQGENPGEGLPGGFPRGERGYPGRTDMAPVSSRFKVVNVPAGAVAYPVDINGRAVEMGTNYKTLRFSFHDCGTDRDRQLPLYYTARFRKGTVQRLYFSNCAETAIPVLITHISDDEDSRHYPEAVITEPACLEWIDSFAVPQDTPVSLALPDYVFRSIEFYAPVYDDNFSGCAFGNTDPIYFVSVDNPTDYGRQLVPGASQEMDHSSPLRFGFYSPVADQVVTFKGLYGALNPMRDDEQHLDDIEEQV